MTAHARKKRRGALVVAVVVAGFTLLGCSQDTAQTTEREQSRNTPSGAVAGKIRGTGVELMNAKFDGNLAIFEGDGWGFNQSLLIFLFLDEGKIPENREFVVKDSGGHRAGNPHVHYRWRDPESDQITTDVAVQGYDMRLAFGKVTDGELPGTIEFSGPGEATRVQGSFRATIKD